MIELLKSYTSAQILFVVVTLALAVKGAVDFWDWQAKHFWRTVDNINKKEKQAGQIRDNQEDITEIKDELAKINDKITILINSDKDDIKNFITEKHRYYCYAAKWIDDYSLECIEKRYQHYKTEGGNSFIDGFMKDIRELPKQSPETKEE